MIIAYKYHMYQSRRNNDLHDTATLAGRAYNHLALHKRYYKLTGTHLNQFALMGYLARIKNRPHYSWLGQALQDIAQRIEKGYQLVFKSVKGKFGSKVRPPTFKKSRKYKSFTLKQAGYNFLDSTASGPGRIRIGVNLEGAGLRWTTLKLAKLSFANLGNANLTETNLREANLSGTP